MQLWHSHLQDADDDYAVFSNQVLTVLMNVECANVLQACTPVCQACQHTVAMITDIWAHAGLCVSFSTGLAGEDATNFMS